MSLRTTAALLAGAAMAATGLVAAHATQVEAFPSITTKVINASGCPKGTASAKQSGSSVHFTYAKNTMLAGRGSGFSKHDMYKSCQGVLSIDVAKGYQVAMVSANVLGSASLAKGDTARIVASSYVQSESKTARASFKMGSGYSGMIKRTLTVPSSTLTWTPCSGSERYLNVKAELIVRDSGSAGRTWVRVDNPSGVVFNLKQRKC